MDEDHDNSDDDKTIKWEESSKSVSSNDDDGNTPSEGIGNLDDLVNGIDNDFDDTPLSTTLNEYNFNDNSSVNNSGTAKSDDDSSLGSDSTVPIPIGGNSAMQAQMHEMHSKETVIPLEGGGLGHITHFNFEAMLKSLLSDPRIRDSLIVNYDNPSKGVHHDSSHVSNVHTAKWFIQTQKRMCTEPDHLLCPINLACDRAHCDEGGKSRLLLEPMLFTLAIIPQELRTQPWAWRPLGYLNNLHLIFIAYKKQALP
eukprot:scaffold48838_cov66-Attheya_sp.AAC.2